MASIVLTTVLSCVLSSFLACVMTIFFMRNSNVLEDNPACNVVSGATRHSRRNMEGQNSTCCQAKGYSSSQTEKPKLILLTNAVKNGARCLDGSPAGYFMKQGHGNGVKNWIIYFNGGAWCYDEQACYQRSQTKYGSTYVNPMAVIQSQGLYSDDARLNPDFYNWNMIFVVYCDGASFTGNRIKPVYFKDKAIYFRGKIILESIIGDLLDRGIRNSREVLLTGSSAGSLAVLIHADYIKSRLPQTVKVRAIADSGYFLDLKTHYGVYKARETFRSLLATHNSTLGLHPACTRRTPSGEQWKCMFPKYFFDLIQTKVFVLQSAYDVWQIINNLAVVCTIPNYHDLVMFNNASRGTRGDSTSRIHARSVWIKKHETQLSRRRGTRLHETLNNRAILSNVTIGNNLYSVGWHWQTLYAMSPAECTKSEIHEILSVYNATLKALEPVLKSNSGHGLFLSPCFEHTQAKFESIWKNVKIKGKTMMEAIHQWYFEKSENNFHIGEQLSFASCVP